MNKYLCVLAVLLFSAYSPLIAAEVIHSERSLYRNIIVDEFEDLRCLKFNVKSSKTNQSCLLKSDPQQLVFNYTKLLFSSLLINDAPNNVLIIGLGGGTMSNAIHQLFPDARIDNVEIDPAVISVARQYFGFLENERVRAIVQDGRIFVKRAALKNQRYDWIILDAFNGDYIPEHLMTKEFFEETKQLLTDNGVLAANTFSISELYQHESATYHAVFGDFFDVSNTANSNRIILVSKQEQPKETEMNSRATKWADHLARLGIDINLIQKSMHSTKKNISWASDTRILTDQYSPANLLNHQ